MANIIYNNKPIEQGYNYVLSILKSSIMKPNHTTVIMKDGKPLVTSNIDDISKLLYRDNKFQNIGVKLARLDLDKESISIFKSFSLLLSAKLFEVITKYANSSNESIISILSKLDIEYNENIKCIIKANKVELDNVSSTELVNYYKQFLSEDTIELIIDTLSNTGDNGVVNIDYSNRTEDYTEIINGMIIDRGSYSDQLIDKLSTDIRIDNPYVFITDYPLKSIREIEPIFQYAFKNKRPLFIIAEDYDKDFLQGIDYIKRKNNFITSIIKTPAYGDRKIEFLNDIASYTGATLVSRDFGDLLSSNMIVDKLGEADKIIVEKEQTKIIGGHYEPEEYQNRIKFIEDSIKNSDSDFNKENNLKRLAKLKSNISIIYIGGYTEVDREYKKEKATEFLNILLGISSNGGSKNPYQLLTYLGNFYSNCNNKNITYKILEEVFSSMKVDLKEVLKDSKHNIILPSNIVLDLFDISFSSTKMRLSTSVVVKK